ncbi:MAG: ATPase domain-containing protein [Candidatus ainarchaeum sp.]|nr:ATPase domain-containing protein [Candidatus ainarchaeum sp.]
MDLGVNEQMPILKKNRMPAGVAELDLILEGGFANPGNAIVIGPSGTEKAALAYHFAAAAASNENSYIICGNSSAADIIRKAATFGISLDRPNIYFIDCYSATLGKAAEPTPKVMVVSGPGALNDLSLMLNEAMKASAGKRMRVVFDTLSTFVVYSPQDSIRKFLTVIEGRLKSAGATTLFLIDEGVHDRQLVSLLEQGMDEIYTITDTGGKFFLRVPDADIMIPIKVGPTGLAII